MIRIETHPSTEPLTGQSKWWGEPDMPCGLDYPEVVLSDEDGHAYEEPLTFVCQLRCEELAPIDADGLLPHEGMLYFFAALDYFLGHLEAPCYPGMGQWAKDCFRVLYAPTIDELHTHHVVNEDGTPASLPAERITFHLLPQGGGQERAGLRLLGLPYIEEVREQWPGWLSLLQVDESDRWGLTFHDCGMLNFLIRPDDLRARRWDKTEAYLFSF